MSPLVLRSSLLLALLGPASTLDGEGRLSAQGSQEQRQPVRVPVTLALVDSIPGGAAQFRILRRVDATPHDIILLPYGADQTVLSEAIADLLAMRALTGDTATAAGMMRVRHPQQTAGRTPRPLPWAGRVMNDLRRAEPRPLAGVGTVPAVEVWLPPQRRRNGQS